MRHWLFHPLLFYPLVLIIAAAVIGFSLMPQLLPRDAAPAAGQVEGPVLTLRETAFDAPEDPPEQNVTVTRDFLGHAQTLKIAVLPGLGDPQPAERGVRILLQPSAADVLDNRPITVEITYRPLPVNAATALAVSLQGADATQWVSQPIPPLSRRARFELPPAAGVTAIGLRAVSDNPGPEAYGVEIVSIRAGPPGLPAASGD
ncbi:MAG: hypothetical protein AB7P07_15425 [Hyphomonadaceae bacterium]